MQVILTQNIKGLGQKGEVKNVKDGYFMNFLAPRKLAQKATPDMVKRAEEKAKNAVVEKEKLAEQAASVKEKLEALEVVIKAKASGQTLYAALTEDQIIEAVLAAAKIRLGKENLPSKLHIKEVGEHVLELKLAGDLKANLKVVVEAQEV